MKLPAKVSGRIPKKWKWTGRLLIHQADSQKVNCAVALADVMDAVDAPPASLKLSYCLTSQGITLPSRVLTFANACTLRMACQLPSQYARMTSNDACEDIDLLARYMHKKQLVSSEAVFDRIAC